MKIITAGDKFTDIDAFASAVAYSGLLNLRGEQSMAVLPGVLNGSIPPILEPEKMSYLSDYQPEAQDSFVIVDVSDPENIASLVDPERIELIIDHHPGYESYWQQKGVSNQIELVGAVCTQVFEFWLEAGLTEQMKPEVARLLASGILDNTLNFTAGVTSQRDHQAYSKLLEIAGLDDSWSASYFGACQELVEQDIAGALRDDTKSMRLAGIDGFITAGQLVVWDGQRILRELKELKQGVDGSQPWFINLVSISDRQSYVICENEKLKKFLQNILEITVEENNILTAGRMWLRKEIIKQAIVKSQVDG